MAGLRVQASIMGTKPVLRDPGWRNGDFEGRTGIISGRDSANNVKFTIGLHNTVFVPPRYVHPLRPCIAAQKTVCLEGEHEGQTFVVVSIKDSMCFVRRPDDKRRKKEILDIPLAYLTMFV